MDLKTNKTKGFINLKSVSAAILSLLLMLVFLSGTIYNYNLPVITAVLPAKGNLSKIKLTEGIVKYEDISEIYSEMGGTVSDILVRTGDSVSKGQPIIEIEKTIWKRA